MKLIFEAMEKLGIKPLYVGILMLIAVVFIMGMGANQFLSGVKKDKDDMKEIKVQVKEIGSGVKEIQGDLDNVKSSVDSLKVAQTRQFNINKNATLELTKMIKELASDDPVIKRAFDEKEQKIKGYFDEMACIPEKQTFINQGPWQ